MKIKKQLLTFVLLPMAAMGQQPLASHAPVVPPAAVKTAPTVPATQTDPAKPVARVNGVVVVERDVREQMQRLFPYYSIHGGKVPEKYQGEIREKAIQQLITDELEYQQARKQGLAIPAATTAKVLAQARQRFASRAEYEAFGNATYGSVAEFERRIRRAIVIAQFQFNEIDQKSKVPDSKLLALYKEHTKSFLRPESVWLQTISVNLPPNPSEEQKKMVRKRIEEILPQARATKSYNEFGALAEKVSEDDYRVMMGDRKWLHLVGMPDVLANAIKPLAAGQVSGVVELPNALTVVRVNERRPQKQMSFAEVKDQLRKELEEATRKDRVQIVEKQVRNAAKIEML